MKIAFFGSTGMLGKPVARELLAAGHELVALVRDETKARAFYTDYADKQISFVVGDLKDEHSVIKTMTGCDVAYLSLSIPYDAKESDWSAEREGIETIIRAAQQTGIKRIGYLSSLIMHYDFGSFKFWPFEVKKAAAKRLLSSGVHATVFYPSTFMETLVDRQLRGNRISVAGQAKEKVHFIAGSDYGKMVVADFSQPGDESREYVVQGPSYYTNNEAADVVVKHSPKRLKIAYAPMGVFKFLKLFSNQFNFIYYLIYALNNMPEPFRGQPAWDKLHKPTITLEEFARNN